MSCQTYLHAPTEVLLETLSLPTPCLVFRDGTGSGVSVFIKGPELRKLAELLVLYLSVPA